MAETRTRRLQRALASLILDGTDEALEADPRRPARRQELTTGDLHAFEANAEGLRVYRDLARMGLTEPLEDIFPVLRSLLEGEGLWEGCLQAFLEARVVRSPHYRDIAPTFLGWLADSGWGRDRWPFLLELAHAELLEVLVARYPDEAPAPGLEADAAPARCVVLSPGTQVVAYTHAVHRATVAQPMPVAEPTHLLAFRDAEGEARLVELTPATAALLVRGQREPLGEAIAALGLQDPSAALDLLNDLRRQGALAGFEPA